MTKLVLLLFLICSPLSAQIHADLKPYHDRYVSEAKARGVILKEQPSRIDFFSLDDLTIHGIAFMREKEVYVNYKYWITIDDVLMEILMFHELHHYYSGASHVYHRPDIMNPSPQEGFKEDYMKRRSYYLDKLFEKCVQL